MVVEVAEELVAMGGEVLVGVEAGEADGGDFSGGEGDDADLGVARLGEGFEGVAAGHDEADFPGWAVGALGDGSGHGDGLAGLLGDGGGHGDAGGREVLAEDVGGDEAKALVQGFHAWSLDVDFGDDHGIVLANFDGAVGLEDGVGRLFDLAHEGAGKGGEQDDGKEEGPE
jgi:hypothetical protein